MRRSSMKFGLRQILSEELGKAAIFLRFKANEYIASTARACQTLTGAETNPEQANKRRKHRQVYEEILRQRQQVAQEAARRAMEGKSLRERLMASASAALKGLKEATSTNAGALALLQHCTAAHAAEVAVEQGIDVKSVTMQVEERKTGSQVGSETVVVGYIDTPNTSEEEMMAFAEQLSKKCPMANAMRGKIEWRRANGEVQHNDEQTTGNDNSVGSTSDKAGDAGSIPHGMPGTRYYSHESMRRGAGGVGDGDELHLPGVTKGSGKGPDK
ncbi:OsmC-like protein, putative [Trypanosoma equiperdum]|uniref:OsmC-like protein, putative n=1 Tax=Trypanosoma equiperdum TaxID=5694 RepID=A0A1G4I5U1_TRYEQ|nr:OsmC-like protein, putative [Trypanosoma equiperdum]